jgi:MYXO-CTERM domain-containing protein
MLSLVAFLLAAPVAEAGQVLSGSNIRIGTNSWGTWNFSATGLQGNFGSWVDFTFPGTPWQNTNIEWTEGSTARSMSATSSSATWTSTSEANTSSGATVQSTYRYNQSGLQVVQTQTWDSTGSVVFLQWTFTNSTASNITNLRLLFQTDPDQDVSSGGGYSTRNDVLDITSDGVPDYVEAVGPSSGRTLGFAACVAAQSAMGRVDSGSSDADLTLTDTNGSSEDLWIGIRQTLPGTLAPGASTSIGFVVSVGASATTARSQALAALPRCGGCDADGDTYNSTTCGGGDCNDSNAAVFPGAPETAYDGVDQDCSGADLVDVDGDGFACSCVSGGTDCNDGNVDIRPGATETAYDGIDQDCSGGDLIDVDGDGYSWEGVGGTDCWDSNPAVRPGAGESTDGVDEDCDGLVDEGTAWSDDDGDGFSEDGGDCDDADASEGPGAPEVADGFDQDCDGLVDEGTEVYDDDGDGRSEVLGDCNDGDAAVRSGFSEVAGNGIDDNCDGVVDDGAWDPDGDGYTAEGGDCDEADVTVFPGGAEVADGVDNDCDGVVDEGTSAWDGDGDGVTPDGGDCNDTDGSVSPEAPEVGDNGVDDDCDGVVDEGSDRADDDGDGFSEEAGDCDDGNGAVSPAAEELAENGVDDDCDGAVDESADDADGDGAVGGDDCDPSDPWSYGGAREFCDGADNDCDGEVDEDCEDVAAGDDLTNKNPAGCATAPGGMAGALVGFAGLAIVLRRRRRRSPSP